MVEWSRYYGQKKKKVHLIDGTVPVKMCFKSRDIIGIEFDGANYVEERLEAIKMDSNNCVNEREDEKIMENRKFTISTIKKLEFGDNWFIVGDKVKIVTAGDIGRIVTGGEINGVIAGIIGKEEGTVRIDDEKIVLDCSEVCKSKFVTVRLKDIYTISHDGQTLR